MRREDWRLAMFVVATARCGTGDASRTPAKGAGKGTVRSKEAGSAARGCCVVAGHGC